MVSDSTPLPFDLDDLLPSHHAHSQKAAIDDSAGTNLSETDERAQDLQQQALDFEMPTDGELALTVDTNAEMIHPDADDSAQTSAPTSTTASEPTHHYRIGGVEVHDVELLPDDDAEQLALDIPVLPPLAASSPKQRASTHEENEKAVGQAGGYETAPPLFE
jgi:hypothetical protein